GSGSTISNPPPLISSAK
nr:Chain B, SMRT [Homo sapiens]